MRKVKKEANQLPIRLFNHYVRPSVGDFEDMLEGTGIYNILPSLSLSLSQAFRCHREHEVAKSISVDCTRVFRRVKVADSCSEGWVAAVNEQTPIFLEQPVLSDGRTK